MRAHWAWVGVITSWLQPSGSKRGPDEGVVYVSMSRLNLYLVQIMINDWL